MERFVQALFERLDKAGQRQLICIMDNAINEMQESTPEEEILCLRKIIAQNC